MLDLCLVVVLYPYEWLACDEISRDSSIQGHTETENNLPTIPQTPIQIQTDFAIVQGGLHKQLPEVDDSLWFSCVDIGVAWNALINEGRIEDVS